ncbi:MAG: sigma-70 family RNA polymerase sigma factor [Rhizobiaceae bacterium]|nr:sigma-70 family RNA polymerase sigma factor [Rhizobiaceae bacterium]|tara:strand:- start:24295 stop:24888 length:594 start_codon:yes stop_codon:yes gene_type:complete
MQAAWRVEEIEENSVPETDALVLLMSDIAGNRDRDAFKALFMHFGPRIKALMLKSGARPEQAEDIVQIVMMTVWRKVHLYAPERGSVSAWIFTIARNARIDRLRRGSSQAYTDIDDLEIVSEEPDGEDNLFASQRTRKVAKALSELPEDQRHIIELAFMEDISQSEIATRLALPLGTVKSRMRLAYAKLKNKLEDLK